MFIISKTINYKRSIFFSPYHEVVHDQVINIKKWFFSFLNHWKWPLFWIIFLTNYIIKNMKFAHVFAKTYWHDQNFFNFLRPPLSPACLSRNGISRNIGWFHKSKYIQVGEKTILHFWAHFSKGIYQCSVVIMKCLKTPGSEVMTWSPLPGAREWWYLLVMAGESRTLTRGGRQIGSSSLASYSSGSKAINLLGRWSPHDGAFKCVDQESEEAVWALGCSLVEPVSSLFSCWMDTLKRGLALPRFYKILDGQVHV